MAADSTAANTKPSDRKTIDKAMQVLLLFSAEHPELAITDIAQRLDMHKSIASRIVSSLCHWGMLERNPVTGRIRVGASAFRIGILFSQRNTLAELAMPLLADLAQRVRQSVHLSVLDGHLLLVIATVESPDSLRVIMRIGDQRHLHATAAGKLFLALSKPDLLDSVLQAASLAAPTRNTITDPVRLREALVRIRRDRIASNSGESTPGAGAIAAPVTGARGEIIAAVSTVFPTNVVDKATHAFIEEETNRCAQALAVKYARVRFSGLTLADAATG